MTEQHIIIDSEQTLEAMLAPVGRDLLHYPCNNPPDAGKHCSKFRPCAGPTHELTHQMEQGTMGDNNMKLP